MKRKKKQQPQHPQRKWAGRMRKAENWVSHARRHLHVMAVKMRKNGHLEESYELLFASRMILDCWNIGEPGLLVGMFYTPDWRAWRDTTAQPKPKPPGLPAVSMPNESAQEVILFGAQLALCSAADLDRFGVEEIAAHATEKAEAK